MRSQNPESSPRSGWAVCSSDPTRQMLMSWARGTRGSAWWRAARVKISHCGAGEETIINKRTMKRRIIRAIPVAGKWWMHLFFSVCCLLSISQLAAARGTDFNGSSVNARAQDAHAAIPDSQFAIVDFDGDRRPDLATVAMARFNSLHSRYWITFQLSNGGPQTVGVTAPAGGLVLFARDVNGDRALDVVLVTAWRHE